MQVTKHDTSLDVLADLVSAAGGGLEHLAREASKATGKTVAVEDVSRLRAAYARAKLPVALEHVRELLDAGVPKILVFGHHSHLLDGLEKGLAGYGTITITGETPPAQRTGLVERFQADPSVRVAVLSIRAASEGITLTAANMVVFAEVDWNPAKIAQAEDRAHRIGQEADSVQVQFLTFDNTLDARMLQVAIAKLQHAERALDRKRSVEVDEAEQHAERLRALASVQAPSEPQETPKDRFRRKAAGEVNLSVEQALLIERAILRLAGVCDGALSNDGIGFNGRDTGFGHSLAAQLASGRALTARQLVAARRMLKTYSKRQIADLWPGIEGKAK